MLQLVSHHPMMSALHLPFLPHFCIAAGPINQWADHPVMLLSFSPAAAAAVNAGHPISPKTVAPLAPTRIPQKRGESAVMSVIRPCMVLHFIYNGFVKASNLILKHGHF